jgi:uncharacterized damage-inducible protein DinB
MAIIAPPRIEPAFYGPEKSQLEAWLDYHRATLLLKCAGLNVDELRTRSVEPSSLTLLGLLRHMTIVEQDWFQRVFAGNEITLDYDSPGDRDADFNDLASATLEEVEANYLRACATSRGVVRDAGLDDIAQGADEGFTVDLRWICVHMIEEYARHNGHADLLRERIDGATGD